MSTVSMLYEHRCSVCQGQHLADKMRSPWIHPVCGHVICNQCQSPDQLHGSNRPCLASMCLYHRDVDTATKLCSWPSPKRQDFITPAHALPFLMSHEATATHVEMKEATSSSTTDHTTPPSTSSLVPGRGNASCLTFDKHLYEACGNCHKQGEYHRIMAVDLHCLITLCGHCFAFPKGHEDHLRDKVIRLVDDDVVTRELMKMLSEVLTVDVVKRVESAYYSELLVTSTHQRGEVNVEEGKVLGVTIKPITQSFFERLAQIRECGYALMMMYSDLKQAYNEMLMMIDTSDKTADSILPSSTATPLSLFATDSDTISTPSNTPLIQFLQGEGKHAIQGVLSRLEGMVSQRIILTDTLDYIIRLLGLPSAILSDTGEEEKDGKEGKIEVIQSAFEGLLLDITSPVSASKAVMVVRTLKGIRSVIDGDDISLELDTDGLEGLEVKEGVNELIIACQSTCKQLQSLKKEKEVETIKQDFIQKCDNINKMLTIETVYTAMEKVLHQSGPDKHLKGGLRYMFGEGGKGYDGAKALVAFDIAIAKGSKEAMFRKAQLLFDWRVGVKRDGDMALSLFGELKKEGLYLPYIYYYLTKHVLERSLGRTAETYKLASEYITKIIEMKYDVGNVDDDNDDVDDEKEDEAEDEEGDKRRKGGKPGDHSDKPLDQSGSHGGSTKGINKDKDDDDDDDDDSKHDKAAYLFAQAGICFIYHLADPELNLYFRRQFSPTIRQWFISSDFYRLCIQAKEAGCNEPELDCMLGYAYYLCHNNDGYKEHLVKACNRGIAAAYFIHGRAQNYYYELRSPEEDSTSKETIARSIMQSYLEAMKNGFTYGGLVFTALGRFAWRREDEEQDGRISIEYLDLAIIHGDETAYYWKAGLYTDSMPPCAYITKCAETAHKIRIEGDKAGCKYPALHGGLGYDYAMGRGVEADGVEAVKYFEKAVECGHHRMYELLSRLYDTHREQVRGLPEDDKKAFQYYLKLVTIVNDEDGLPLPPAEPSDYNWLGHMYESGRGTSINYDKAVEYYKKAGEKNDHAMSRLGIIYDTSQTGVPHTHKNDKKARSYYEIAKKFKYGYADVYVNLGNMYRDGRGGDVDGVKAIECYDESFSLGWVGALYEKALIYDPERKECPPIVKDERRAIELYLAAEGNDFNSKELFLILADCYTRGRIVKKDEAKAEKYERQAEYLNVYGAGGRRED